MVATTEALKQEKQKLYDALKTTIKSDTLVDVFKVLSTQTHQNLLDVFNVENPKLYDLLNYTTYTGKEIAGAIFKRFKQVGIEKNFQRHLSDKIYDAIVSNQPNQESVAEGIWEFAGINHMDIILSFNLDSHFIDAILNNNQGQDNANKIFNFAKKHNEQHSFLINLDITLRDAILKDQKDNVINILNFASNNNVLKDVLDYRSAGGTALELAKQIDRTEIVKIIEKKKAELETQAQKDLLNLADELYSAIKGRKNIKSILASNGIQNVLMSMEARGKEGNYYTFLIHAINCNYEEAAIDILNIANPDTLKPLLKERQEVMIKGRLVDYTALKYATEKGHQKLVKIIEKKKAGLETQAQHEQHKAAGGQAAPPQSGQGEPHEEGDMPSTTSLTPAQQTLYNDLKTAIESGIATNVYNVLNKQDKTDLLPVFDAGSKELCNLLNYTTHNGREIAGNIYYAFTTEQMREKFLTHLSDRIYDAIVSNQSDQEDVAEGMWEFVGMNSMRSKLLFNLGDKFMHAILHNQGHENEIFSFAEKRHGQKIFLFHLNNSLLNAILTNQKNDVVNILNFASNHGVLKDVLDKGLDLAKQKKRIEIVKIIEAASATLEAQAQHEQPKAADGRTSPPQSGQGKSHKEGDMPSTTSLTPWQQTLYDDLKTTIKSGIAADVDKVLSARRRMDLSAKSGSDDALRQKIRVDLSCVFNAENPKLYDLLNYTTDETRKAAQHIFEGFLTANMEENFISHLSNKIHDAVMSDNSAVTEGILQFAKTCEIYEIRSPDDQGEHIFRAHLFDDLIAKFKAAINNNRYDTNKIFHFAKKHNEQDRFLLALNDPVHGNINSDKNNKETALKFPQKEQQTVEGQTIEEKSDRSPLPPQDEQSRPRISLKEYWRKHPNYSGNKQNKGFSSHGSSNATPTFFSKHGGKIAFGTIGLLLVIGGAVLCGFGQLAPGISLLIMGVVLAGAFLMQTEKVQEMWDKASDKLSDLFVSKQEPNLRDI